MFLVKIYTLVQHMQHILITKRAICPTMTWIQQVNRSEKTYCPTTMYHKKNLLSILKIRKNSKKDTKVIYSFKYPATTRSLLHKSLITLTFSKLSRISSDTSIPWSKPISKAKRPPLLKIFGAISQILR